MGTAKAINHNSEKLPGVALVLGKFLPPHRGHQFLIDMARNTVSEVVVVVGTLKSESIPGKLRYEWMKELHESKNVRVLHLDKELPQAPEEHPDFWNLWKSNLLGCIGRAPDYVVASENYGYPLAETLGAKFIPVNISRSIFPVSGTAARTDPIGCWEYLPRPVRNYFLKNIAIVGPESCGKTTLCEQLATHFHTRHVPEYAREYLTSKTGEIVPRDLECIGRCQKALRHSLVEDARGILFHDTELFTTELWSQMFFDGCSEWIKMEARQQQFDLYLLLTPDITFVPDNVRYFPEKRRKFFSDMEDILSKNGCRFEIISGSGDERKNLALKVVNSFLEKKVEAV